MLERPGIRIVDGLAQHAIFIRHQRGNHIHQLSQARQAHPVRMSQQGVEKPAHQQRVLQVVHLLQQVRGFRTVPIRRVAAARSIPHVPLVERQPELLARALQSTDHIADSDDFLDLPVHGEIHGQVLRGVATRFFAVAVVTVQRDGVHFVVALFEHLPVPLEVRRHERTTRAAGDELERRIEDPHLPRCVRRLASVVGGRHVTDLPGSIHLVAKAPVLHPVRGLVAVLAPQVAPARALLHVAVLNQSRSHFRAARAEIHPQERLATCLPAPGDEFVGAKPVGFERVPGAVEDTRPVLLRSHSVKPVIAGNEIAARVADDGYAQLPDFVYRSTHLSPQGRCIKCELALVRMETPVLYFYADRETAGTHAARDAEQLRGVPHRRGAGRGCQAHSRGSRRHQRHLGGRPLADLELRPDGDP